HRADLADRLVDVVQVCVKGARLARPSPAGYEQNSTRRTQQAFEFFLVIAEEAEFAQAEEQTRFIQHAHHNTFAVVRWDGGDAQINRLLFDFHLYSSIIRQTLLRYYNSTRSVILYTYVY